MTTERWKNYWVKRKIDWDKAYLQTWTHPHRALITSALESFGWLSLIEIGCGAGANLVRIIKHFPDKQLGGVDISKDAIELANNTFKGAIFKVGSGDDIPMSDDASDVVLSDMFLIYVGPFKIRKYLREMKRIARDRLILCEFHSVSLWRRLTLWWGSGYYSYNYRKLLERMGFYDIMILKVKESDWPGGQPQKDFAYLITAKVPKRK